MYPKETMYPREMFEELIADKPIYVHDHFGPNNEKVYERITDEYARELWERWNGIAEKDIRETRGKVYLW